jgi:hypothetical protein
MRLDTMQDIMVPDESTTIDWRGGMGTTRFRTKRIGFFPKLKNLNPLIQVDWRKGVCVINFDDSWIYRHEGSVFTENHHIMPQADRCTVQTGKPCIASHIAQLLLFSCLLLSLLFCGGYKSFPRGHPLRVGSLDVFGAM